MFATDAEKTMHSKLYVTDVWNLGRFFFPPGSALLVAILI